MMRILLLFIAAAVCASPALAALSGIEDPVMDKNYESARSMASRLLKEGTDSKDRIEAEYYLGLSQLRMGQYGEARRAFRIVMEGATTEELYEKASLGTF